MRCLFIAILTLAVLPIATAAAESTDDTEAPNPVADDSAWWHFWNMFGVTWFDPGDVLIPTPIGVCFDLGLEIGVGGTEPNSRFVSGLLGFSVQTVSFDEGAIQGIGATGMHLGVLAGQAFGDGLDIFGMSRIRWLAADFSVEDEPLVGLDGHVGLDIGMGLRWLFLDDDLERNWFLGLSVIGLYGILDNSFTIGFDVSIPILIAAYAN